MRHGSLFSGIGGFDLAAEWMGWENVFHCEWNEFGQKVLKHHFPKSISYADITKTDFSIHRGSIDILTGGFPCQPYSSAGKRKGKEDERHLWPQMLRAIREIAPSWVVGENVYGLVNWSGGLVFHEVQSDLEAEGYEVFPFLLPAVSVNAPHRRDRIWFVAHSTRSSERTNELRGIRCSDAEISRERTQTIYNAIRPNGDEGTSADTCNKGLQGCEVNGSIRTIGQKRNEQFARYIPSKWQNFPSQSPVRWRDDGLPDKLLKFVVNEFYDTISYTSEENRIQNLHEVWEKVQSQEIWEKIRGFYSLESKDILFQTMQLYSTQWGKQKFVSPFSEEVCKTIMQHLSKYGEFRCSPQGQELEKQRYQQFGNSLSFLPHEVALASRRFETAISKFESWHRNESIKAYGNAVVPQVVYQIFKTIEDYVHLQSKSKPHN